MSRSLAHPTLRGCLHLLLALGMSSFAVAVAAAPPASLASTNLHHLFRVTPTVLSGASPEHDAAFAELRRLGVSTVISVDGAPPDVEAARRHGLRYVHLPIGYDAVPDHRWAELLKASQEAPGQVYVHCHHGRHRGPAAAAILGRAAGWSATDAEAFLRQAGTSEAYAGLYRSVARFQAPDPSTMAVLPPLPEVARTTSLVEAMVAIDEHTERLKSAQAAGWTQVPGHPDLRPAHEALLLVEQFRELARHPETAARSEAYRKLMTEAGQAAAKLENALRGNAPAAPAPEVATIFQALLQTCVACHRAHRD